MRVSSYVLPVLAVLAFGSATQLVTSAEPATTANRTDVATVKKSMTSTQLALGDPITNRIGVLLVPIPVGEFRMGSPDSDRAANDDEKPQRLVKITKPFYLSVNEVTQTQYEQVMGVRPWQGNKYVQEGRDYPATWVAWRDAVEFCRRLSEQEGVEYRLPTEAEWEYACRAGSTTAYSFGDEPSGLEEHAWYDKNAWDIDQRYAHRVGQKVPNGWGLYDLHGNAWEWCQDEYRPGSSFRVLRGGSFSGGAANCRSAHRNPTAPDMATGSSGFRVARDYP